MVYIARSETLPLPSVSTQTHTDRLAIAKARIETAWQKALNSAETDEATYNRRHWPLPVLKVGDKVFIRNKDRPLLSTSRFPKLDPPKTGPITVAEVLSRHRVRLDLPPHIAVDPTFDVSQLDLAPAEPDPYGRQLDSTPIVDTETPRAEPQFEVERIVGERIFRNRYLQYRVKWKGNPTPSWEFAEDLAEDNCTDAINDWRCRDVATPPPPEFHGHDADEDGLEERPIAFISTTTSPAESKMVAIELEISCLAWAMHRLQHYLDGAVKIIVITDHAPLPSVLKASSHSQKHFTPRIEKLRAYLMPMLGNLEFRYKQGKLHANVDALSRLSRIDS